MRNGPVLDYRGRFEGDGFRMKTTTERAARTAAVAKKSLSPSGSVPTRTDSVPKATSPQIAQIWMNLRTARVSAAFISGGESAGGGHNSSLARKWRNRLGKTSGLWLLGFPAKHQPRHEHTEKDNGQEDSDQSERRDLQGKGGGENRGGNEHYQRDDDGGHAEPPPNKKVEGPAFGRWTSLHGAGMRPG